MDADDAGLVLIRAVTGGFFFCHGALMLGWFGGGSFARTKAGFERMGFRPLLPFAISAPGTQLVCGLMVLLGFLWPVGPAFLVGPMLVAVVGVHWPRIWVTEQGIEYPLVMGVVMLGLGLLPAGELSLDNALGIELPALPTFAVALALTLVPSIVALVTSRSVRRARAAAAANADAAPAAPQA